MSEPRYNVWEGPDDDRTLLATGVTYDESEAIMKRHMKAWCKALSEADKEKLIDQSK
jgi:hypothetical protein